MGTTQYRLTDFGIVTVAVASLAMASSLISSGVNAGVLPGSPAPVLSASNSGPTVLAVQPTVAEPLNVASDANSWISETSIGDFRTETSQAGWTPSTYGAPPPNTRAASMGIYDGFQNSYGGSFDRNTAVVVMDPDDGWRKSNQFFGKQFRASLANWSSFATGWTAPPVADQEAQWNEVYKPQQKYRTISEFCPLDISKESSSARNCAQYSESILSFLRVMNNFIGWVKSILGSEA